MHQARRAGLATTSAEVLCFLDADDSLPPDYLAAGLPLFSAPAPGLVYSDAEFFDTAASFATARFDVRPRKREAAQKGTGRLLTATDNNGPAPFSSRGRRAPRKMDARRWNLPD